MYISLMRNFDAANGPGIRTTLFVSGCTHNCPECFNAEAQNFKNGQMWNNRLKHTFIDMAKNNVVTGITILGGEPFQQDKELLDLVKSLKEEVNKSIWIYSGYTFEEILLLPEVHRNLLYYVDVLVDGKFIVQEKDLLLRFKGSSNQRVIDVKKSLLENKAVIIPEYNR